MQLNLDLVYQIPAGAIYAKVVEKCGDRKYWPQWAADVAQIAERIRARVAGLLADPERITLRRDFQAFLADLRRALHRELQEADLVAMIAQHLVTGPVFQALFADYDFVGSNPVSRALSRLVALLEAEGLENETRDLEPFYESVRQRAQALDNAQARQKVLLELYERFFQVALRKDAERLGIVYTPVAVVDFILQSANQALQQHFGRQLTDKNVHILDPFTGTGTFMVRLLQNPELIRQETCSENSRRSYMPTKLCCWPTTLRPSTSRRRTTAGVVWRATMRHLKELCSRTPSTCEKGQASSRNPCPSTVSACNVSRSVTLR